MLEKPSFDIHQPGEPEMPEKETGSEIYWPPEETAKGEKLVAQISVLKQSLDQAEAKGDLEAQQRISDQISLVTDDLESLVERVKSLRENYENYECLKTLEGHNGSVRSISESHDHRQLISGSFDKTIKIWDKATGECLKTLEGHNDSVHSVSESHDHRQLISGSTDGTIKIWDKVTGKCLKTLEGHNSSVWSVSESHDHRQLISGSRDCSIKIWGEKE